MWNRVFIERPMFSQLVKEFPTFYGSQRFIAAFTKARYMFLSRAISYQSTIVFSATDLRSILTLHSEVSEVFQAASTSPDCRRIPIPYPVLKQLRLILTPV